MDAATHEPRPHRGPTAPAWGEGTFDELIQILGLPRCVDGLQWRSELKVPPLLVFSRLSHVNNWNNKQKEYRTQHILIQDTKLSS